MAIKSLCFFHFVEDFERPIEALRKELDDQRDAVDNSLIVLPEAFNIGDYWRPRQESDYDPRILNSLSDLAVEFNCILVAGLTIRDSDGPQSPKPPYTSCFLIDGKSEAKLLCRKFRDDQTPNYTPSQGRQDVLATLERDGLAIGALICMDASLASTEPIVAERQDRVRSCINASPDLQKLVCIPARMGSFSSRPIADRWRNETIIFANGASHFDAPSFISVNGRIIEETWMRTNQLRIHKIPPWPIDYEFLDKLNHKMSKRVVTRNLAKAGLFVMAYESLERSFVGNLRDHYLAVESDGKRFQVEVASKAKKLFDATCIWYVENNVLSASEIDELKIFRKHRNELAHEMLNVILGVDREIDGTQLHRMTQLIAKLNYWWALGIELPSTTDGEPVLNLEGYFVGPASLIASLIWYTFDDN